MFDEVLFEQRLKDFTPEPMVPPTEAIPADVETFMVQEDDDNIDLAKANYLNVLDNEQIKKASEELIREYGVGTCGPRAFYGTTDVHLELEERLAQFLHVEEAIVYSYGFVAISSAIAAYCKKNDVVFVDEKANVAIEHGLEAAKSRVVKFAHNDPHDFEAKACEQSQNGKKRRRMFLIVEGVSWSTGKLCPLLDFIRVAEQFKMRIFLEESYSLGVLGATGRGLTEYYDVDPSKVDMVFGTLEGPIGSIGGFCAGSNSVIEHQRLSGSGYIFSASLPTYLVKALIKSVDFLEGKPREFALFAKQFHEFLEECGYMVVSHPESPFKIIAAKNRDVEQQVHEFCKQNGVHFIHSKEGLLINLKLSLSHDKKKLEKVRQVLRDAAKFVI